MSGSKALMVMMMVVLLGVGGGVLKHIQGTAKVFIKLLLRELLRYTRMTPGDPSSSC